MLVVPTSMRRKLLAAAHLTHIGIEGCIRRMRDTLYWPRKTTKVREYGSKCEICLAHRDLPGKEPIIQHEEECSLFEEDCSLFDPKYKHININTINNHVLHN